MVKCEVQKCCSGCSLKLGVILIGVLIILVNFVSFILILVANNQKDIEALEDFQYESTAAIIFVSLITIVYILIGICLTWAAIRELPKLLRVGNVLYTSIFLFDKMLLFLTSIQYFDEDETKKGTYELFKCITGIVFVVYYSIVIYSFRLQIQRNAAGGPSCNI